MKVSLRPSRNTNLMLIMIVRYMLFVPIIYGLCFIIYLLLQDDPRLAVDIGTNLRVILLSSIAVVVTFAFAHFEKHQRMHLPTALLVAIMTFAVLSLVIGDAFGQYGNFWWWDDMLHASSGVIAGFVGYLLVYFYNGRYNMRMNPLFVGVFAFTFAIAVGVVWEIFEFSVDYWLLTDMQGWSFPPNAPLIGKPFQGSGLRDTMSDLIVSTIGALIASMVAYFTYKNNRRSALKMMRQTFPNLTKRLKS